MKSGYLNTVLAIVIGSYKAVTVNLVVVEIVLRSMHNRGHLRAEQQQGQNGCYYFAGPETHRTPV